MWLMTMPEALDRVGGEDSTIPAPVMSGRLRGNNNQSMSVRENVSCGNKRRKECV
jgi:hypothetical protein